MICEFHAAFGAFPFQSVDQRRNSGLSFGDRTKVLMDGCYPCFASGHFDSCSGLALSRHAGQRENHIPLLWNFLGSSAFLTFFPVSALFVEGRVQFRARSLDLLCFYGAELRGLPVCFKRLGPFRLDIDFSLQGALVALRDPES